MAAFNDPAYAVHAAVDIQKRLKAANHSAAPGEEIHVKIGIHAGKALLDEGADFQSLTGDVANVAARIQDHAGRDEILLSQFVFEQIKEHSDVICRFHNDVMFKGKAQPITIYRVAWGDREKEKQAVQPFAPETAMDADAAVLVLEINHEDDHLKISINESRQGEENTIRHYETIPFAADRIEARCKALVEILNKAKPAGPRGRADLRPAARNRPDALR